LLPITCLHPLPQQPQWTWRQRQRRLRKPSKCSSYTQSHLWPHLWPVLIKHLWPVFIKHIHHTFITHTHIHHTFTTVTTPVACINQTHSSQIHHSHIHRIFTPVAKATALAAADPLIRTPLLRAVKSRCMLDKGSQLSGLSGMYKDSVACVPELSYLTLV